MSRYSDEYIERWGEVFEDRSFYRRTGVPFIVFLQSPELYVELDKRDSVQPLLPAQQAVLARLGLTGDDIELATEALLPKDAELHGERNVSVMRHRNRKNNPMPRHVRHTNQKRGTTHAKN